MPNLSPQAQAVFDAYMANCGWLDEPFQKDYQCVAAVLRAVVQELKYFGITEKNILAFAAELETISEEDDFTIVVELEDFND